MSAGRLRVASVVVLGGLLAAGAPPAAAQTDNGEWRSYGGDIANTRYSPLDQIDAGNFNELEVAWRLNTANFGPEPEFNYQSTPLMVDGVIYTTAGLRRAAVAADAGTGELLWMHRLDEGERAEVAPPSEATTVRLAEELGQDPDVMLALAGKVSSDLQEIIRKRPRLFADLIRQLKEAPDDAVLRIVREVRDGDW